MKKIVYLLALLFMAGAMVTTSCTKDEDDEEPTVVDNTPRMTFIGGGDYTSNDATLTVNEEFMVGINASENSNTKNNIASFEVARTFNNISTTVYEENGIDDPTYSWESTEMANAAVGEERWTFTVTDNGGGTKELSFIITTKADGSAVLSIAGLDMGSYDDSDFGSFLATAGTVMKKAEASAVQDQIDIVFFYGASNGITFGAPSNETIIDVYDIQDWTTKNMTLFMPAGISAADFEEIGNVYAFPSFTGDTDIINGLAAGEVFYFKTVTDKLGYIKINSTKKDGFEINIDMKIME